MLRWWPKHGRQLVIEHIETTMELPDIGPDPTPAEENFFRAAIVEEEICGLGKRVAVEWMRAIGRGQLLAAGITLLVVLISAIGHHFGLW